MSMTILKNAPTHAVVSFIHNGTSNYTLDLDTLAIAGSQTAVAPTVNIDALYFSAHGGQTITVTRNGVLLWSLANSGFFKLDGFTDNRQNTSDIVVSVSNGGSLVLELKKVSGYGDSQHIPSV